MTREGADELTLRAEEAGMLRTYMDTTDVGDSRWVPPLVDEDWHAEEGRFQGADHDQVRWQLLCVRVKSGHKQ